MSFYVENGESLPADSRKQLFDKDIMRDSCAVCTSIKFDEKMGKLSAKRALCVNVNAPWYDTSG